MASIITISELVQEFGAYYIQEGQNMQRLVKALSAMPQTLENHARHISTDQTEYRMANYKTGSILQPFKAQFNPISSIEFIPNTIPLQKIKVDVSLTPDEIEDSYIGFLSGNTTKDKKDWPLVRFIMEEYIAEKINEDRELNMVYLGKRNDNGNTPADCMDGIKQLLLNGTTSGHSYPINVIETIGELSENTIFDQIEAFDKAIDNRYWNKPLTIFVAPEMYRAFLEGYREKGFYNINSERQIDGTIDFTGRKHVLAALPSMAGTKDIWATTPDNLLWLTSRRKDTASADIQPDHYNVDIMINWREGIGFACNQMVWTSKETVQNGD